MCIIIKGLDMPKSCYPCTFNRGEYTPEYYEKRYCDITGHAISKKDYKKRPKDCPLMEVNPK